MCLNKLIFQSMDKYLKEHREPINNIFDACAQLKLSSLPRVTACIIYHRCLRKQKELDEQTTDKILLAATCVYLAAKIDEEPVKIRDLVNVFYRLCHHESTPLSIDTPYWNLRDSVTTSELMLLRLLNFQVTFDTPHKYLLHYLVLLEDWATCVEDWKAKGFSQICFNILNDVCYSPLISDVPPQLLSTAIIYFVLDVTKLKIAGGQSEKQWFQVFCPTSSEDELKRLVCLIMKIYDTRDNSNLDTHPEEKLRT